MYPFNSIKWAIVEFFYGMANFSSKVLEKVIGTNSFITKGLTGKGVLAPWLQNARTAAWAILMAYLVWVGVKMVISKEPPRMKNVLLQLVTSIFLIISMGSISKMLVNQSVSWYNEITGVSTSGKKASADTSSLAYNVIKNNTNDIQYIITTDFGTLNTSKKNKSSLSNPLISKKGKNYYGTIMDKVPKVKYGYNVLTKGQLDQGKVQLDEILNWKNIDLKSNIADVTGTDTDLGKADKKKFDDLKEDWEEGKHLSLRMLWYQLETYTDADGKTQIESPDIGRIGTTIFAFGGYPRFQIDFWPTIITLAAITVAYLFAGYAIIKSFLELGLMNILGIFIFAVDLDSGNKTKQVVQAIFSTSLLVALQGLEIAFYQIAMTFGQTAKNDGTFGSGATAMWAYVLFALVATTLLITGSQRVTDFFGVDTGAQHGMRGLGGAMYAASKVGHGLKRAATAPGRAVNGLKNMRDDIGHTLNTEGSMKRDAKKQAKEGARQDAINKMAGVDAYGNKVNSAGESGEKISDLNASRGNKNSDAEGGMNAGSEAENESPIDQNDAENEEAENKKPDGSGIQQTPAANKAMSKVYAKAQKASDHAQRNARRKRAIASAVLAAAGLSQPDGAGQGQMPDSMSTSEAQEALDKAGVTASPATQAAMQKVDQAQAAYDQAVQNGDPNAPQLKQELDGAKQELAQSAASDIKSAQGMPAAKGISVNEARRALDAGSVKPSQATQAAMQRVEKAQAAYDKAVSSGASNAPQLKQELAAAKQDLAKTTANDIKTAPASGVDGATAKTMLKQAGVAPSEKTSQLIKQTTQAKTEWRQAIANGSANAPELKQKVEQSEVQLAKSVNQDIGSAVAGKATTANAATTKQTVSQTATGTAAAGATQQVQQNVHQNVSQAVQTKPGQASATTTTQTINQTAATQAAQPTQQNVHQNVNQTVQSKPGQASATTTIKTINQTGSVSASQPTQQNVTQNVTQNVREIGGSGAINQTQNVSQKMQPGQTEKHAPSGKSRSDAPIAEKPTNGTNVKDFSTPKSPTDKQ